MRETTQKDVEGETELICLTDDKGGSKRRTSGTELIVVLARKRRREKQPAGDLQENKKKYKGTVLYGVVFVSINLC